MAALPSFGGPLAGGDPFMGHSGFGFSVPQGDPGAIAGAAGDVRALGAALSEQEARLGAAGDVAGGTASWGGAAATAFADYTTRVVGICGTDAGACERAATALASFSHELAQAQRVTRHALTACQTHQQELTQAHERAATSRDAAQTASQQSASAPDPIHASHFAEQARNAEREHAAAQKAAAAAQHELDEAKRRGREAAEAYEHDVASVTRRLQAAPGAMRPPPRIAGGAPVPVTVSAADSKLALKMADKAGSLDAAAAAALDPKELEKLAGGPVTPGAALAYVRNVLSRQHWREVDPPLDGSVGAVIPGPVGQVADGAWDALASGGKLVWSGVTHPKQVPGAVSGFVGWAATHPVDFGKGVIDWDDWSHGRPFRAIGSIGAGIVTAKGLGKVGGAAKKAWKEHPEIRPEVTRAAGKLGSKYGIPHADDLAELAAPLSGMTAAEIKAAIRDLPRHVAVGVAANISHIDMQSIILADLSKTYSHSTHVVAPKAIRPPTQHIPKAKPVPHHGRR